MFKAIWYRNMMVGGDFGHHALILSIPQDAVQIREVLEDVKALIGEVSGGPATQLWSLQGKTLGKGNPLCFTVISYLF